MSLPKASAVVLFDDNGISIRGHCEQEGQVQGSATVGGGHRIQGQIVEINADDGIAPQRICSLFQFRQRISPYMNECSQ